MASGNWFTVLFNLRLSQGKLLLFGTAIHPTTTESLAAFLRSSRATPHFQKFLKWALSSLPSAPPRPRSPPQGRRPRCACVGCVGSGEEHAGTQQKVKAQKSWSPISSESSSRAPTFRWPRAAAAATAAAATRARSSSERLRQDRRRARRIVSAVRGPSSAVQGWVAEGESQHAASAFAPHGAGWAGDPGGCGPGAARCRRPSPPRVNTGGVRGCGGGGRACGSGCGRGARCSPCSAACCCCCCCACSGAPRTHPPAPGNPPAARPAVRPQHPSRPSASLGRADFRPLRGQADGERRPAGGVGWGRPGDRARWVAGIRGTTLAPGGHPLWRRGTSQGCEDSSVRSFWARELQGGTCRRVPRQYPGFSFLVHAFPSFPP